MVGKTILIEKCPHCGHEWIRRKVFIPPKCPNPKCGRRYYGRDVKPKKSK